MNSCYKPQWLPRRRRLSAVLPSTCGLSIGWGRVSVRLPCVPRQPVVACHYTLKVVNEALPSWVRSHTMRHRRFCVTALCAMLLVVHGISLVAPPTSLAHPLGNFSISRYAGLRFTQNG